MSRLQEGPALWGTVPGVLGLRASSSLAGLAELRGQCELAGGGVDPGAWKSILRQLQMLQVEVWGFLGWGATGISPCAVVLTFAFFFPKADRFFSWLEGWAGAGG